MTRNNLLKGGVGSSHLSDELVPEQTFCEEHYIAPSTARRWRQNGAGPEYLRIGSAVFYFRSRIRSWHDARTFRRRADATAA